MPNKEFLFRNDKVRLHFFLDYKNINQANSYLPTHGL